jgi:hypothetical protein
MNCCRWSCLRCGTCPPTAARTRATCAPSPPRSTSWPSYSDPGSCDVITTVFWIRNVYPGSGMFIPDPNFSHPGSLIRIKEFKYLTRKKWFLNSQKYDPGCSSRIRILIFTHPGSRDQKGIGPDPCVRYLLTVCNGTTRDALTVNFSLSYCNSIFLSNS